MQYQQKVDEYLEHQKVERVIGMREGDDGTEYLVKCKSFPCFDQLV
jgi:hypothetical protein